MHLSLIIHWFSKSLSNLNHSFAIIAIELRTKTDSFSFNHFLKNCKVNFLNFGFKIKVEINSKLDCIIVDWSWILKNLNPYTNGRLYPRNQ